MYVYPNMHVCGVAGRKPVDATGRASAWRNTNLENVPLGED